MVLVWSRPVQVRQIPHFSNFDTNNTTKNYGVPLRTKIRRIIFYSKSNVFAVEVEYFEFEVEYIKTEVENRKFEVENI